MTTEITGDSVNTQVTSIDDTDSPYTTQGESVILVDTTNGTVTVELSTADATASNPETTIKIVDVGGNAATNNITVSTEGSETINPGGASSKTIQVDSAILTVESDGSNWYSDRNWDIEKAAIADAKNSDIGDSVDYLDPRWLALTTTQIQYDNFTSLDGYTKNTSGSGSATTGDGGLDISTGSTQSSHAEVKRRTSLNNQYRTWGRDRAMIFSVRTPDTNEEKWVVAGGPIQGSTTRRHVGIHINGTTVNATAGDGSTQSETAISGFTLSSIDNLLVRVELSSGSSITVTLIESDGTEHSATHSSNIPSGNARADAVNYVVENPNAASDSNLRSAEYCIVMKP